MIRKIINKSLEKVCKDKKKRDIKDISREGKLVNGKWVFNTQ